MVSKSSYEELKQAYDERGKLLFEAVYHIDKLNHRLLSQDEYYDEEDVEAFLSRARIAGFA